MKTPRIITKIGDLFEVPLDGEKKRYFQFVTIDATQLNSGVIGVFKSQYPLEARPTPDEVIRAEVDFYAHPMLKIGILQKVWTKIGKSSHIGSLEVLFRGTNDILDPQIKFSENWHVWKISERPQKVGRLVCESKS